MTIWLDKRMQWFAAARGKSGRSPKFSDAAIQFFLTIKNLFGLVLRQTMGFVEHGPERRRQWRKLHVGIDAKTLQIRAICVTSNDVSDAVVVADLLEKIPCDETVLSLTGDGAYDTQPVYEAAIQR